MESPSDMNDNVHNFLNEGLSTVGTVFGVTLGVEDVHPIFKLLNFSISNRITLCFQRIIFILQRIFESILKFIIEVLYIC